jgi:hypothetical protein
VLDRSILYRPFMAESVETFQSRRSLLAHLLVKRFAGGGASEAGAWTDQKTGSALLHRASEGLRSVKSRAFFLAMLPKLTKCGPDPA